MELTIGVQALVAEMRLVQSVISGDRADRDLVRYEAADGALTLTAHGGEMWLRCACDADVAEDGSAVARVKLPLSYLELVPEDASVRLTVTENNDLRMNILRLKANAQTPTIPAEALGSNLRIEGGFPHVPADRWSLPSDTLHTGLRSTISSVPKEASTLTVPGGLLTLEPEKVRVVATDGHRLAVYSRTDPVDGLQEPFSAVVGRRAMLALDGILVASGATGEDPPVVKVASKDRMVSFECGQRRLVCQTMPNKFPDYQRVMPAAFSGEVEVDRAQLASALRRVSVFSERRSKAVRFDILPGEVKLQPHFLKDTSRADTTEETIEVEYDGEPAAVGINGGYVLDFTEMCRGPKVRMRLGHSRGPVQLEDPGPDPDTDYRYVIMPVRL